MATTWMKNNQTTKNIAPIFPSVFILKSHNRFALISVDIDKIYQAKKFGCRWEERKKNIATQQKKEQNEMDVDGTETHAEYFLRT